MMVRRAWEGALEGLDLAECAARQGTARDRAFGFADLALQAAQSGDAPRMARCLESAQRERRRLRLADQVAVLDRLARAALASEAPAFARVLHGIARDCAQRVRRRKERAAALAACDALAESLGPAARSGLRVVFYASGGEHTTD